MALILQLSHLLQYEKINKKQKTKNKNCTPAALVVVSTDELKVNDYVSVRFLEVMMWQQSIYETSHTTRLVA